MKRILLALSLSYSMTQAFAQGAPPPVPAEAPKVATSFIAQGESVEIPEAGFTITPPMNWEVIRNGSAASLLFQGPKPVETPGVLTYQANIRIMKFDEPRPLDDFTKDEFSKIISEKISGLSSAISDFNIRSAEKVKLQNADAFLYYSEFKQNSIPMMQMHVLVSSGTKHFLMSYTDLATVFEQENSPGLTVAYTSMQSVKLDSEPEPRFQQIIIIGGGIVLVLILLMLVRVIRVQRMKRMGERIESEDGGDATTDDYEDSSTAVSAVAELDDGGHHDDEYEDMPETQEVAKTRPNMQASKPVVAQKVVKAPAAAPAPAPKAKPAAVPAPKPVVTAKAPEAPVTAPKAAAPVKPEPKVKTMQPISEETPSSDIAPLSNAWNLNEADSQDEDGDSEVSGVSEIRKAPVIASATKAKHQKITPPVRMKEPEMDEDKSEVARLSEILPNTGDSKKKKKGFFGWGKSKDKESLQDDDQPTLDAYDDNDEEETVKVKPKGKEVKVKAKATPVVQAKSSTSALSQPVSQVSEIAEGGWNLDKNADSDADDEED